MRIVEFVFALTTAAIEDEAVVTLAAVANKPVSSVASESRRVAYDQISAVVGAAADVSVRVPLFQTSAARVPKVVRLRALFAHTAVGTVATNDEDAVSTVAVVLLLMVETAELTWVFVFVFTIDAIDEDALRIDAFVEEI